MIELEAVVQQPPDGPDPLINPHIKKAIHRKDVQ